MRQAGRYLPEYRAIRKEVPFLDLCKTPELAAEVSLQPYRILGVDGVIFFSDILIPVEGMGIEVSLTDAGPQIGNPVRTREDVSRLRVPEPDVEFPFTGQVLSLLRKELEDGVPLIGFAGAPWTLASYMIEGGGSRSFAGIKRMAWEEPAVLHALRHVADVARSNGKGLCVCGEMATDPQALLFLIGIGVREMSMAAPYIPQVKKVISTLNTRNTQKIVKEILALENSTKIRQHLGAALMRSKKTTH